MIPSRLADPEFFAENRLPARSDHRWFADAAEAAAGVSSYETSLNGEWAFHHATNADGVVPGFEADGLDVSGWDRIQVPGHVQLAGYGVPQYVNTQYPWDGWEDVRPGQVPTRVNPVSTYVRDVEIAPLGAGERVILTFHGAESALALWVNGTYVGYATDSFTPSEFDLTDVVRPGANRLAVQVYHWSSGSWLEDQDFFRFSGLFRDVVLTRVPRAHLEDLEVRTEVADDLRSARVLVTTRVTGGTATPTLDGVPLVESDGVWSLDLDAPRLWSSEDPHLYRLVVEVRDSGGALTEVVPQAVGVRRFGIEDGLLKINGARIVFKGVNRHDFGRNGRYVTRAETEADIRIIKAAGLNAVRTSHYPNNRYFYELCDEYGLYVIDEMNLETHGLWDGHAHGVIPLEDVVPGDRPEWRGALFDRAASLQRRDRNHPSVVIWSLGNESFGGTTLRDLADWFRERDTRPVHYEGVHWDRRYPETTDITSQMYTPAAEVERQLGEDRSKPFILCEFAHAMGNSFGAVDEYVDLAYREPLFQGVFIWDFADQALELTDAHGRTYFGYGGDFGDRPHDGDFSGNGILFADHTPKPFLAEVAYLYQGLKIAIGPDSIEVTNRELFTRSSAYDAVAILAKDGAVVRTEPFATDVAPGQSATYPLPFAVPTEPGVYTVDVEFRLKGSTAYAEAGHVVASEQAVLDVPAPSPAAPSAPELVNGLHNVGVHGADFSILFSRLLGGPVSYRWRGRELLDQVPMPNFWHAPTSNERGWGAPFEDGQWLLASRYARPVRDASQPALAVVGDAVEVTYTYDLPTRPASSATVTYRVDGAGRVEVTLALAPGDGVGDLPELGLLMEVPAALDRLTFFGEGPHESYADRRGSARLGIHEVAVADALTPYLKPQESGSRTGVRWAEVTDSGGAGIRLEAAGMEFSALPWTPFEIENARHPNELPPIHRTVLRPALARRGVAGDDSWGSRPHPQYLLPQGELTFTFAFVGIG